MLRSASTAPIASCCSMLAAKWSSPAIRWGFRPLCYAIEGPLFAAASESVALLNLGFCARKHPLAGAGPHDFDQRRQNQDRAFCREPAAGALLLRVDLFCERGQHDR